LSFQNDDSLSVTDDCTPGIHPHMDQPNWRPGDA
jgi:hypothetical protein